jgi:hypothetical protein
MVSKQQDEVQTDTSTVSDQVIDFIRAGLIVTADGLVASEFLYPDRFGGAFPTNTNSRRRRHGKQVTIPRQARHFNLIRAQQVSAANETITGRRMARTCPTSQAYSYTQA